MLIVMFLSFRTDTSGQKVQTQIRLLLEEEQEQSDLGLHCLQFRVITANFPVSKILRFLRYCMGHKLMQSMMTKRCLLYSIQLLEL